MRRPHICVTHSAHINEPETELMAQLPSPQAPRTPTDGSASGELRLVTTRPCPSCHTPVSVNASLCPACGESLPSRNKQIRCRRCGGRASAALVVCPHCGRELQPAPPRLLAWGAPIVLILLFAAALFTQLGGAGPVAWTQRQAARVAALVDSLGARLQPDITITTIPVADASASELVSQPAPTSAEVAIGAVTPMSEEPVTDDAPTATPLPPTPTSAAAVRQRPCRRRPHHPRRRQSLHRPKRRQRHCPPPRLSQRPPQPHQPRARQPEASPPPSHRPDAVWRPASSRRQRRSRLRHA